MAIVMFTDSEGNEFAFRPDAVSRVIGIKNEGYTRVYVVGDPVPSIIRGLSVADVVSLLYEPNKEEILQLPEGESEE